MIWPVLALLACQEPFGTDRHDLEGDRIAAVRAVLDGEHVAPRAALVVDGKLWSDDAVTLRWYRLDDIDALEDLPADAEAVADGPAPTFDREGSPGIGLVATFPSGTERRAWLPLSSFTLDLTDVAVHRVDGVSVSTVTAADLELEARALATVSDAETVAEDGFARLTAAYRGAVDPPSLRWMSVGGAGTFFELARTETDWAAGELRFDDDEAEEREAMAPGAVTVLALALDGRGGSDFRAADFWVGDTVPTGVRTRSGRWLGTDTEVDGGFARGTLVADDDAPTGLTLVDAVSDAPKLDELDPFGDPLDCDGVQGAFDPSWLLDGRCTRDRVVGADVLVRLR